MSKKMLKRSLALGALMAFVITGSAMAADINETITGGSWTTFPSNGVAKGYENVILKNENGGIFFAKTIEIEATNKIELAAKYAHAINYTNCDLSAPTIIISGYTGGKQGTYSDGIFIPGEGTYKVNLHDFNSLTVETDTSPTVWNNGLTEESTLVIAGNAGSIVTIENKGGRALSNTYNGVTTVSAGTLNVFANSTTNVINATSNKSLTITVDNLNVENRNTGTTGNAINVENGVVNINVKDTADVKGVIGVSKGGVLNINTTGEEASFTGQIVTAENATTNVTLNDATWNVTGDSTVNHIKGKGFNVIGTGNETLTLKGIAKDNEMAISSTTANINTVSNINKIVVTGKYTSSDYQSGANGSGNVFYTYGSGSLNLTKIGSIVTDEKFDNDEGRSEATMFKLLGGTMNVDVINDINIKNAGNGIQNYNGTLTMNAADIKFDVVGNALITQNGGNSTVVATDSAHFETSGKNNCAVYAYGADSTVSVNAKTVNIKAPNYAVYAYDGGAVEIGKNSEKVNIEGNVLAAYSGVVDINLGNEGSLNGQVYAYGSEYGNNIINLNLGTNSTWILTDASALTNATFAAGSNLVINGADFVYDATEGAVNTYAINGSGTADVLKVDGKANIKVEGIDYKKYNVATGFEDEEATKTYWNVSNLNTLMQGNWIGNAKDGLQLEVVAKAADKMETEMGVSSSTAQSLADVTKAAQQVGGTGDANGTGDAKAVALVNAIANAPSEVAGQVFEAVSKMAEAGGNSATAARVVNNVTGVTNDRLSFNCGHSAPHKGGHGVGLFEEGSGADVWVEYVHGKDKVEDMPSTAGKTSYEGQYNGIVMGVDFKKVNKFQSGFAFNYGEGDTNSVGSAARTHSDYDFWGIGYYGSIHNDDSNVIFDIGYAKTDSDVETKALGMTYNASPETTTWTAGVKVEKLYQNENVQIVPYTGLRFMSIDPEDYTTECASSKYQMERQNVWLLPLGVSIKQEVTNDNGWTVSPRVDLSYIWAFGDTDSEMEFSTLGTKTNIGYEVMDDGSFLGLVGIEAHKGQWGFGVSYSYQKGDHSESKKWFIDANYSF